VRIRDLGRISYADALALQLEEVERVQQGGEDTLFLLEHPPVITLGKGGGLDNLHVSPGYLKEHEIELVQVKRGGNITCHFPGQLVAYPVFRIEHRPGGIRAFFHDMEETVIRTLARYGLAAGRSEGRPGVWLGNRKICSMGIGVKRWVTWHGLALNVLPDVSLFQLVTLCGLADAVPTSVHAEMRRCDAQRSSETPLPTLQEIKGVIAEEFRTVFKDSRVAENQAAQ